MKSMMMTVHSAWLQSSNRYCQITAIFFQFSDLIKNKEEDGKLNPSISAQNTLDLTATNTTRRTPESEEEHSLKALDEDLQNLS